MEAESSDREVQSMKLLQEAMLMTENHGKNQTVLDSNWKYVS